MEQFETGLVRVENGLHVVACGALLLIAGLINADIVSRVLFQVPIQFQFEFVEFYLMPIVATLSLSRVFRDGGHLAIELLDPDSGSRFWVFLNRLMLVSSAVFLAVLSYKSGQFAFGALTRAETYLGYFDWPLGWAYVCVPVGCFILTVRLLLEAIRGRQ